MKKIYLDYAASRPVREEALKAMEPFFAKKHGNASSMHSFGQQAKQALEESRALLAKQINAEPEEIYFTSGGTEGNNWALKGLFFANTNRGHIITSKIEHDCVLNASGWLESRGASVTYLPVGKGGLVNPDDAGNAIRKDTLLVSVMHANNEIGAINDIEKIAGACGEKGVLFHTDACQSFTKVPIDVKKMGIGMMTINAHKIYGPQGVGALYIRKGIKIEPLLHGGGHERGMRSTTENIPGVVGFAKAAELGCAEMKTEMERQKKLRDCLVKEILKTEDSWINGSLERRLADNANFGFRGVEGESVVLHLDAKGVAASTGSACSSSKLEPSHVLLALGLKPEEAHGSLRLTMGIYTTKADVDYVVKILPQIIENLRKISPFKFRNQ
ncbi:MAG: cysteine desulfurase [Nanoarchaeota archaeon]|nr:cysteine desulfurase [Nanoarchaeota archaeon]